jgi:hypothetical protein
MRNYIIVAGVDYKPIAKGISATNFMTYGLRRSKNLFHRDRLLKEDLIFYLVDIRFGKINKVAYIFDSNTRFHSESTESFKKFDLVEKANYGDWYKDGKVRFHPNGKKIISKYDIYDLVEHIGTENPKSLIELSIFSHGYYDGPILLNSSQHTAAYIDPVTNREIEVQVLGSDPNDYDMRKWDIVSYLSQVSNYEKMGKIRDAFAVDGRIWIWGCNFYRNLHVFLYKVKSNRAYRKEGLSNATIFKFPRGSLNSDIRLLVSRLLASATNKPEVEILPTDELELSFEHIRRIFCQMISFVYAFAASQFIGVNVFAGLPTTYSSISPDFKISADTISDVQFFQEYLDFEIDELGLKYGIYKPEYDCEKVITG